MFGLHLAAIVDVLALCRRVDFGSWGVMENQTSDNAWEERHGGDDMVHPWMRGRG